jgi:hypothetical protein
MQTFSLPYALLEMKGCVLFAQLQVWHSCWCSSSSTLAGRSIKFTQPFEARHALTASFGFQPCSGLQDAFKTLEQSHCLLQQHCVPHCHSHFVEIQLIALRTESVCRHLQDAKSGLTLSSLPFTGVST